MTNKPKTNKWVDEWKKIVKVNFDGLGGRAYGKGETELKVELLGIAFIQKLITQTQQETLEWVLKEVVGEDEGYTGNNDFHQAHTRDEFRAKQRQTIKQKMEGK
jgi:hypothetical protein